MGVKSKSNSNWKSGCKVKSWENDVWKRQECGKNNEHRFGDDGY